MVEQKQRSFVAREAERVVSRVIEARQRRAEFFRSDLFADAAWDILLQLFLAELQERDVEVTDLGIFSSVPDSTAGRWLEKLARDGFVRAKAHPADRRRSVAQLSGQGCRAMHAWLTHWLENHSSEPDDRARALLERIGRGTRKS